MDAKTDDKGAGKCPFTGARGHTNRDWWPDALSIEMLHRNSALSNPMDKEFDYAKEFKTLDLDAVIKDLRALMTDSQPWWPADFGHYGGLMIRLAWHAAWKRGSRNCTTASPARSNSSANLKTTQRPARPRCGEQSSPMPTWR